MHCWSTAPAMSIIECLLGAVLVAGGCSGRGQESATLAEVEIVPSALVPAVVEVSWTSPEPGESWVEYGLDEKLILRTPSDEGGVEHRVTVLGLKEGRTYHLRAITSSGAGPRLQSTVIEHEVAPQPARLPRFRSLVSGADPVAASGWTLTSVMLPKENLSWVVIVDRDGDVVWWYPSDPPLMIPTAEPGRDGRSILFGQYNHQQRVVEASLVRVALDGSRRTTTRTELAHHDFAELPDGTLAWLASDARPATYDGEEEPGLIAFDAIMEGAEGGGQATRVFSFHDDYEVSAWAACEHSLRDPYQLGARDWIHANALVYDEASDDWFIVSRNLDAVWRVDRSSREVLWQMGGRDGSFDAGPDGLWSHPHITHIWDGGLVAFDNGNHYDPPQSRIVEYAWDESDHTVLLVREYLDPGIDYVPFLGDVKKLDNGALLASWSTKGLINEISTDGRVVWGVEAEDAATGRVSHLDSLYPVP